MKDTNLNSAGRSTSRIINQMAIADIIYRRSGNISKVLLAKELKLSKPAVSANVADLIAMGFVEERGEGEASRNGGRKPIMLYFNYKYRYIGSFDFSLKEPVCAIGDLSHKILKLEKIQVDRNAPADEKRRAIADTFKGMLSALSIPAKELGIIVISHPGIIGEGNDVRYVDTRHNPWTGIGLKTYLGQEYNVPVVLENNVKLSALGEMFESEDLHDLIYVSCGIGLGSGLIVKGKIYDGINRAAGEIGSFLCGDGRRLEDIVAMDGLLSRITQLCKEAGRNEEALTFKKVVDLSKLGDKEINQGIREIGHELGRIIYNTSILMDIPTVIFGGDYLHLGDVLFDAMEEMVTQSFLPFRPKVLRSGLREAAGIFGGFVIGREKIIEQRVMSH